MQLIEINEAKGGWTLQGIHIRLLMELYPSLQYPLSFLLDVKPSQKWPRHRACQEQRRKLFTLCIDALDNTSSIEWRLPLSFLTSKEQQNGAIVCSPATLLVDGLRRFEMQMQCIDGESNETRKMMSRQLIHPPLCAGLNQGPSK